MTALEQLQPNASVRGIASDCAVTVVSVQWFGSEALELKDRLTKEISYWDHRAEQLKLQETGKLRFIEVKGRISGTYTITVTRNEILYSLDKHEEFILAIVEFLDDKTHRVPYVRRPFQKDPDFGVTSASYDLPELLARAEDPR